MSITNEPILNNKYFTPSIEDLHIGYECEEHEWCMDEAGKPELNYDRWVITKITAPRLETILKYGIRNIRVPYLTKEQIEAEGWVFYRKFDDILEFFKLDAISLRYNLKTKKLAIGDGLFYGECKDINTFRYICKLLKI